MPEWQSYIQTEPGGTYHVAFRNLSFPRMMEMLKLYVQSERERHDAEALRWLPMPDEGI